MCQTCPSTQKPTLLQRIAARTPLWVPVIIVSIMGWAVIIAGLREVARLFA